MYGLLAVFAMLLSTAVAWACALWSPIPASRSLPEAEAAEFLTDGLGVTTFASRPGGIQHSGIGVTFTLAGVISQYSSARSSRFTVVGTQQTAKTFMTLYRAGAAF